MTIWILLNNPATTLVFMAAIGIAALLVGVRELILRGAPHVDPNAGDEPDSIRPDDGIENGSVIAR